MQKDTKGKVNMDYIPFNALEQVMLVREFGSKKYNEYGYTDVPVREFTNAALRHLLKARDETYDKESGLNHLAHAACSLLLAISNTPEYLLPRSYNEPTKQDKSGLMSDREEFHKEIDDYFKEPTFTYAETWTPAKPLTPEEYEVQLKAENLRNTIESVNDAKWDMCLNYGLFCDSGVGHDETKD